MRTRILTTIRPRALVALLALLVLSCGTPGNGSTHTRSPSGGPAGGRSGSTPLTCPSYDATAVPAPLPPSRDTGTVGTIPGSFSVTPAGQANYTMPLTLPPGRVGMQPQLSVGYDSSGGESYVGVGFSLGGLSSIRRCPWNIAQDGQIRPVKFDTKDKFCLDGLRLVPVASIGTATPNTTEFRTFPDVFSKVIAHLDVQGNPDSFTVYNKAGRILTYAGVPEGRAMAANGVVASWWLTQELDRHDNGIDYHYTNDIDPVDGHTREIVPLRIDYANRILFEWQTLPPALVTTTYDFGLSMRRSRMLTRIQTQEAQGQNVKQYNLQYIPGPSTHRMLLSRIEECTGDGSTCKPATTFQWGNFPFNYTSQDLGLSIPADQAGVGTDQNGLARGSSQT